MTFTPLHFYPKYEIKSEENAMRNDQISDQMGRPATDRVGGVAGRPTPAQRLTGHAMQPTPRKPLQVKQLNNAKMFSHLPVYPTKIQRQRQK